MNEQQKYSAFCTVNGLWNALPYDHRALSEEQIERLRAYLRKVKQTDEEYLRVHTEIPAIINFIFRRIERDRPVDLCGYCCELFSQPMDTIQSGLREEENVLDGKEPGALTVKLPEVSSDFCSTTSEDE